MMKYHTTYRKKRTEVVRGEPEKCICMNTGD
jgi:hypothetical protein